MVIMQCYTCSLLIVYLFLSNFVQCDESKFKSVPTTVKAFENDTVLLPCHFDNNDNDISIRWYRGEELIGDTKVPHKAVPEKYKWYQNGSLEVTGITASDTGEYTCEVIRLDPWAPIKQTHNIEVQYAPVIRTIPEEGYLEVKKGEEVEFRCEADGTPEPLITWYKNGEEVALLNQRNVIRFKADDKRQGGNFVCKATNGVGDPTEAYIKVLIQDAPVVTAVKSWVHTSPGLRAALEAKVESVPTATTHWYKSGQLVHYDSRVVYSVLGDKHQLVFRNVRENDLGEYTFRAENPLGMADLTFKLTGVPNKAVFKVDSSLNKATATSFTLLWTVDSYTSIIEYHLWLRPFVSDPNQAAGTAASADVNPWMKIVVPAGEEEGPIKSCNYTVRGLTPSGVYEAMVTSKNRFGWSKPSAILHFATEPGVREQPSTSEYNENIVTPIVLEEADPEPRSSRKDGTSISTSESSINLINFNYIFMLFFVVIAL